MNGIDLGGRSRVCDDITRTERRPLPPPRSTSDELAPFEPDRINSPDQVETLDHSERFSCAQANFRRTCRPRS